MRWNRVRDGRGFLSERRFDWRRRRVLEGRGRFPLRTLAEVWKALSPADRKEILSYGAETHAHSPIDVRARYRVVEAIPVAFENEYDDAFKKEVLDAVKWAYQKAQDAYEEEVEWRQEDGVDIPEDLLLDTFSEVLLSEYRSAADFLPERFFVPAPRNAIKEDVRRYFESVVKGFGSSHPDIPSNLLAMVHRLFARFYGGVAEKAANRLDDKIRDMLRFAMQTASEYLEEKHGLAVDLEELYGGSIESDVPGEDWSWESIIEMFSEELPGIVDDVLSSAKDLKLPEPVEDEGELEEVVWRA